MKTYIQIDSNKWIVTEGSSAEVVFSDALLGELSSINKRLAEIPADITDNELLAWAKLHYPAMDYSKERQSLENRKSVIEVDVSNMGL